jgi:hypothetical protein
VADDSDMITAEMKEVLGSDRGPGGKAMGVADRSPAGALNDTDYSRAEQAIMALRSIASAMGFGLSRHRAE